MKKPVKKAQFGNLLKKAGKAVAEEGVEKAASKIAKKVPGIAPGTPQYSKKGLGMAIERRTNPEAAAKKMTKAQRQSFEVDNSYMKSGGKMKKGGMAAFEKTAFDKKADAGKRHGGEGSAKDKKMDKIDAKKMGFIKGKKK